MKDDLKKYLNDNRQDFERNAPSDDLWSKINEDLRPEKKKKDNSFSWRIAASIAIVLGLGAFFLFQEDSPIVEPSEGGMAEITDAEENLMSNVSSDLEEVETYYSMQVNNRMNQLQAFEIDEDLILEIDELKKEFEALKKEMGVGADQSMIVEAMINNYRLRLMLLEDLLHAVDNNKQMNTKNYERDI